MKIKVALIVLFCFINSATFAQKPDTDGKPHYYQETLEFAGNVVEVVMFRSLVGDSGTPEHIKLEKQYKSKIDLIESRIILSCDIPIILFVDRTYRYKKKMISKQKINDLQNYSENGQETYHTLTDEICRIKAGYDMMKKLESGN